MTKAILVWLMLLTGCMSAFAQAPSPPPVPGLCATGSLAVTNVSASQPLPGVVTFTGAIAANVLTTSAVTGTLANGQTVTGTGVPPSVKIVKQLTGAVGGAGTYQLSIDNATIGSIAAEAMTAALTTCNFLQFLNDGASEVFLVMDSAAAVATTTVAGKTLALPAGSFLNVAFTVNAPYVAAITAAGTSTLRIYTFN